MLSSVVSFLALQLTPLPSPPVHAQRAALSAVRLADDKAEVEEYFNNEGFNRWNKIYSDSDEVNKVQMDIRDGHGQTVDKVLAWLDADGSASGAAGLELADAKTSDLESLDGNYDTVTCIDVMIHYPPDKMKEMVSHLAGLADKRLIISFAPDTWYYRALKKIGELAPGPSKTTRAYLHEEGTVRAAVEAAGFKLARTEMTGTNFYFSRLFEAVKA